jgi:hypothetical protein
VLPRLGRCVAPTGPWEQGSTANCDPDPVNFRQALPSPTVRATTRLHRAKSRRNIFSRHCLQFCVAAILGGEAVSSGPLHRTATSGRPLFKISNRSKSATGVEAAWEIVIDAKRPLLHNSANSWRTRLGKAIGPSRLRARRNTFGRVPPSRQFPTGFTAGKRYIGSLMHVLRSERWLWIDA